jgi:hypothetical protein
MCLNIRHKAYEKEGLNVHIFLIFALRGEILAPALYPQRGAFLPFTEEA